MRIAAQLTQLQTAIDAWAQANGGGGCKVAGDLFHAWDLLASKPGAPRVILLYRGETPRGDFNTADVLDFVDRTFWAVISRGRGFNLQPGDSLTKGVGGGRPLFDLVEELRDVIRGQVMEATTCERPVYFRGITPFDAGDLPVDAYQIEFSIGCQIAVVVDQPQ